VASKKAIPRIKAKKTSRQSKTAVARQSKPLKSTPFESALLKSTDTHVVYDIEQFQTSPGEWDKQKLRDVKAANPEKLIEFTTKGTKHPFVFRERSVYFDKNNELRTDTFAMFKKSPLSESRARFVEFPTVNPKESNLSKLVSDDRKKEQQARTKMRKAAARSVKRQIVTTSVPHPTLPHVQIEQGKRKINGRWKNYGPAKFIGLPARTRSSFLQNKTAAERAAEKRAARVVLKDEKAAARHSSRTEFERRTRGIKPEKLSKNMIAFKLRGLEEASAKFTPQVQKEARKYIREIRKQKNIGTRPHVKPKPIKKAPKKQIYYKGGQIYNKRSRLKLRPSQYLDPNRALKVVNSTAERVSKRAIAEQKRARAKATRELTAAAKATLVMPGRRAKTEKLYAKGLTASAKAKAATRHRVVAAAEKEYAAGLKRLPGYGRIPIKMVLRGAGMTANEHGKRGALAQLDRSVLYPPSNHASGKRPAQVTHMLAGMRGAFGPYAGRQTISPNFAETFIQPSSGAMSGWSGNVGFYSTAKTVTTTRFPNGGRGLFIRIDAEEVIQKLLDEIPSKLRWTAARVSQSIGQRLLDIVEPYVPKDTGLLYTTARAETFNVTGGFVDIEGGEAYPSGQTYGVSISYNAPYAEVVYFDQRKLHGAAYNAKYGGGKGELETARWIDVAFESEGAAIHSLFEEYAAALRAGLQTA